MLRIGISGIPSTGKTVTARAVAGNLWKYTKYNRVELIPEYAREYIANYGLDTVNDQLLILDKQLEREELIASDTEVMITDSPIFLGFAFALLMRRTGNSKDRATVNALFDRFSRLNEYPRYDVIFHLAPSIKFHDDGVRAGEQGTDSWRARMEILVRATYTVFPPKDLVIIESASLDDRIKEICAWLNDKGRSK